MIKKLPLKNNILFTTALTTSLFGYYRRAEAACTNDSSPIYSCAGTNSVTQAINYSGATVSTVDGFSVTTASGNGITISGDEDVSFTDSYGSTISGASLGMHITSTGSTNINLSDSQVASSSNNHGIEINHDGPGELNMTTSGSTAISGSNDGIHFRGSNGSDASLIIAADTTVQASTSALYLTLVDWNNDFNMEVHGNLDGDDYGIFLRREILGDSSITIEEGSDVHGGIRGIFMRTSNANSDTIVINGDVTGDTKDGVRIYQAAKEGIQTTNITVGENATLQGNFSGLYAMPTGLDSTVTINGTLIGGNDGLRVRQLNDTGDSITNITVSETASITAGRDGIVVRLRESFTTSLNVSSDIVAGNLGINIYHVDQIWDSSTVDITINSGVSITGDKAISSNEEINPDAENIFGGPNDSQLLITLDGSSEAISLIGTGGMAIDLGEKDDSLTITGAVNISGNVDGGDGTDTLTIYDSYLTLTNGTLSGFEVISITGDNTFAGNLDFGDSTDLVTGNGSGLNLQDNEVTANSVEIAANSTLSGNGTITVSNGLTVKSGGIIAPGNSTGTINVIGDVTFESGSNFNAEIEVTGTDLVNVTGDVTIKSGSNLNISSSLGNDSGSWTFLTASGTIDGSFDNTLSNKSNIFSVYSSGQSLSIITLNRAVLDSTLQSSVNSSILFNDTLTDQIAEGAFVKGSNFWIRNINRNRNVSSSEARSSIGFDSESSGFALGAQIDVNGNENYKLGFSLSSIFSKDKLKDALGSSSNDSIFASIYGIANRDLSYKSFNSKLFTSFSLGFGHHNTDNSRKLYNSGIAATALSNSETLEYNIGLQIGLKTKFKNDFFITPRISASYIRGANDGFNETDGGVSAIKIDSHNFSTLKTRESIRFGRENVSSIRGLSFSPYVELGLSQEQAMDDRTISGSFSTGAKFQTNLEKNNRKFTTVALGVNAQINQNVSAFVNYENANSNDENRNEVRGGVRIKF
jgi:hypothetical protein